MTWMEVMVGVVLPLAIETRRTLATFALIMIDAPIMERAVAIRRDHRIKLTDAIIWATAQMRDMLLVTRNTKDFPPGTLGVRIPYAV